MDIVQTVLKIYYNTIILIRTVSIIAHMLRRKSIVAAALTQYFYVFSKYN